MSEMIVTVLSLNVREGCEEEFARAFRGNDVLEHARKECGMLFAQLLRPATAGAPFVALAHWPDAASYDCWIESPVRDRLNASLGHLLTGEPASGDLYTPVAELADE